MQKSAPQPLSRKTPRGGRITAKLTKEMRPGHDYDLARYGTYKICVVGNERLV